MSIISILSILDRFPKRAPGLLRKLAVDFGRDRKLLRDPASLIESGFSDEMVELLCSENRSGKASAQYSGWRRQGIGLLSLFDEGYPAQLSTMADCPVLLFFKGNPAVLSMRSVSIVGARHADQKGTECSFQFGYECAAHGLAVVSGLALGIDGAAHRGALRAKAMPTAAVLGNGVDSCYPPVHRGIFEEILDSGGCIASEYFPGMPPYPGNFLERNRIIAGLSELLIVVQAAKRSGSLRTANAALEYGKEVAAVPWDISNRRGEGCNRLLQQGAQLITGVNDIFELLGMKALEREVVNGTASLSASEKRIIEVLEDEEELHIDELKTRTSASELEIVNLEVLGHITRSYGNMIRKAGAPH